MPDVSDIQKIFPSTTKTIVNKVWGAIPEQERQNLEEAFKGLPLDKTPLNSLIDLAIIQYKTTFGKPKKVAIIGPANVGKSTLFNQFIRAKSDKADVGPIPGTTRINQEADAGMFSIVDTPGADAVGYVGQQERDYALNAASQADFLILMFDAIQGIKQTELDLYEDILSLKKPYIIVLNKIDLTRKVRDEVIKKAAENLNVPVQEILPVSALRGEGISRIMMAVVASDPTLTISLAQAMPQYRQKLAWRSITTAASLSAAIALTPLPVIDFIPLMANQVSMVLNIARIYQFKISAGRARELLATFGLGMLGRTLFQQLSKAGGIPGWLLSSAIASSMTVVMGYASIQWFEKGEQVNQEKLGSMSKKLTQEMLAGLKTVFKKKPSKQQIEEAVSDILAETPLTAPSEMHPSTGQE
ncbi:MAG: GTPase [Anaerolineaceae bacterium]